ncbi:AraC family transcriptional regulator, regulatory protein of adaptative response / methylated-DNA-[protein]-cysteine methyltransferase [Cognatiyoonia koreensis]|uniref:methylated-DNA--[protein]-cysteine S-methyltransferase n=1 Tax=Cognatiyoonia koreensis TaxID=364200 RepID=A0A1I0PI86_9RHOB|nr:trifunctional transcriptional activator/DNA repair protein Ada/methylated-DNA--[protein]-cysteine S-methyltransferase [Cognatiyoonia koreensis]SEW14133.1 AraC family transcriptional regulator, regulatory protein of adaptative response / methylated-DNA-[protein]-cysteine methyltransferase [Cognatiyoonia koreensis]
MLFELPPDQTLYDALLSRDHHYDGRAFVGVSTTGVFCRLTCPARKPKRENCTFFDSQAAALDAGFRPCKRCHPLSSTDPTVQKLLDALNARPAHRWTEADIAALDVDPSTARKGFKRAFGMTFLEMARQQRLALGFNALADNGSVIDAQLLAGFESGSAFRASFAKRFGMAPATFRKDALLQADFINTPIGAMIAVSDRTHLHLLEFFDRKALPTEMKRLLSMTKGTIGFGSPGPTEATKAALSDYFAGKALPTIPLALHGSAFTKSVWRALINIPAGETRSYSQLAHDIGQPNATRAVARANGANQIAILIPCHRVICADGSLTGYGGGLWRKQKLLETELKAKP